MKKLSFVLLFSFAAVMPSAFAASVTDVEEPAVPDSLNIPVWIVDGVEIVNSEELPPTEDVESITVVKNDSALLNLFRPRMGGIIIVKTKSKTRLKEVIKSHNQSEEQNNAKPIKPGTIRIR